MAYSEIKPKLKQAILENKKFKLLILIDKNNDDKNIPLHEGFGLKKIKDIEGCDEKKHRWISGNNIYDYLYIKYFVFLYYIKQ